MELHDVPASGEVVQVVDVLGDEGSEVTAGVQGGARRAADRLARPALRFQACQRQVRRVRFRLPEVVVEYFLDDFLVLDSLR